MKSDMKRKNGVAIAIAWPKFVGKQTGTWYDKPMMFLGFNKDFHYQVGHASMVLINKEDEICRYFDCGRYHAPYQHGRIRDSSTDPVLSIITPAKWTGNSLGNFAEILNEIQGNPWTFGVGPLEASYCEVNFEKALEKIKSLQSLGALPFGPFTMHGTNCCRFVRTGILAGEPQLSYGRKILLNHLWHLKPMPISIVQILKNKVKIPTAAQEVDSKKSHSKGAYTWETVHGTLPQPPKPSTIPITSQWLAGEVAGSWFNLEQHDHGYTIVRYSQEGVEECSGTFKPITKLDFNADLPYEFTHLSHCNQVCIRQGGLVHEFGRIGEAVKNPLLSDQLAVG